MVHLPDEWFVREPMGAIQCCLIIDTNNYAGSFSREMAAYITGMAGEDGVGQGIADAAQASDGWSLEWVDAAIPYTVDRQGFHIPVDIIPTPGFYTNGRGEHFPVAHPLPQDAYLHLPWPCHQSISLPFNRALRDAEISLLAHRASLWARICRSGKAQDYGGGICDNLHLQVLGIRVVTYMTSPQVRHFDLATLALTHPAQ